MDTLLVFCALMIGAAFLSLLSIGLRATLRLVTGNAGRAAQRPAGLRIVDPFEPADTSYMHFDPRMTRQARAA